jgi:hypothetical protein
MSPQFHRNDELSFKKPFKPKLKPPTRRLRISEWMSRWTSDTEEKQMFRKSVLALAAVAALGTAALAPTGAEAHWSGYGWYGNYSYQPYFRGGFYGPHYFHGGWKYGTWRKFRPYY